MNYRSLAKLFDSEIILEGGKVFPTTTSIDQDLIPSVIHDINERILKPLGLDRKDWETLGSVGKKTSPSNDIDIAVVKPIKDIERFIRDNGFEYRNLKGLDVISIAYPVNEMQNVQLDLMPTDNLSYSTWAYHSPDINESQYNGTYRNALLEAIASEIHKENLTHFASGEVKEQRKQYYSYAKGLMERLDSYVGKKGKPIKKPITIERKLITKNPQAIARHLLGEGVLREHTNSFESIYERMMSDEFPYKEKISQIKEKCRKILRRKNLEIPKEMVEEKHTPSFKEHGMLEKIIGMPKIPHMDQMSINQIQEFFNGEYEYSEKLDGANFSVGVVNNRVYGKSKKDKIKFNASDYYDNADLNDIFLGMGNFLKELENNDFIGYYNKILGNIPYSNLQFFGEIFYNNQVNALTYENVGKKGTYVVFGLYGDGADISNTVLGEKLMESFVKQFNEVEFPVRMKKCHKCELPKGKVQRLLDYIKTNESTLKGRKRDPEFKEKKAVTKKVVHKLLGSIKKELLQQSEDLTPMLGGSGIEGLIMKNLNTNKMVKLVDLEKFGELNARNWSDRNVLRGMRRELFKELMDMVQHNDILTLPEKREESLRNYLSISGKKKFMDENEIVAVLANDIQEESELDAITMRNILNLYAENVYKMKFNLDNSVDDKHYNDTVRAYDKEINDITEFVERISKKKTPQIDMIKFMMGEKILNKLKISFL